MSDTFARGTIPIATIPVATAAAAAAATVTHGGSKTICGGCFVPKDFMHFPSCPFSPKCAICGVRTDIPGLIHEKHCRISERLQKSVKPFSCETCLHSLPFHSIHCTALKKV